MFWTIVAILIALVVLGVIIWLILAYAVKPKSANLSKPNVVLEPDARKYYSIMSTDGQLGRNDEGDLVNGSGVVEETGFKTATDLSSFPLTFAMGHPYWSSGTVGNLSSFSSWNAFLSSMASSQCLSNLGVTTSSTGVLVIEGPTDGTASPVILDLDLTSLTGVVIRQNGILLVKGPRVLNVQFVLVESGGLFQAGSNFNDSWRFQDTFTLTLVHPSGGFDTMGSVASQYSWTVYAPGASKSTVANQMTTDYTGTTNAFCNDFGAKVIGVGFNGSIHMAGMTSPPTVYANTWTSSNAVVAPMTVSTGSSTFNIETSYPATWARLANASFAAGTSTITIDPADRAGIGANWSVGAQVVITNSTSQYQSFYDPQAMMPLWVDNDNAGERALNLSENTKYIAKWASTQSAADKQKGVEVQKIASYNASTGVLTLQQPLQFTHNSTWTTLTRSTNTPITNITVQTCLHVGLLTRNILFTSALGGTSAGGCNKAAESTATWMGPGGHVVCNTLGNSTLIDSAEVYSNCYLNQPATNATYCNNLSPTPPTSGHWIFGTGTSSTSCNAILAGHSMYHYGASVCFDSVEMKLLGQPSNFGSVARYAVHFHLAGYISTFKDYLPTGAKAAGYSRSGDFVNSSVWCTFSRWATIHGTHEVNIKNNVFFISFGSGIFVEDGTETNNTIEHNLAIATLTATFDAYYNSIPIMPNVSSDMCMSSTIWLKNSQNRVLRNVLCNSPSPVIGIWMVPQKIGSLRGPSSVCLGDPVLGLPSIATMGTATGSNPNSFLSQSLNHWQTLVPARTTACWVPSDFPAALQDTNTKCLLWGSDNSSIPYQLSSENVIYNMFGGMSEFPEAISLGPCQYNGAGGFQACPGSGFNTGSSKATWTEWPNFLPVNGQNSCTDQAQIAQASYFDTSFGGGQSGYPYQPISAADLAAYNATGLTYARLTQGNVMPKFICNMLTYNLGSSIGTLWGGSAWIKDSMAHFINCCFLETSWRLTDLTACMTASSCPATSAMWSTGHGTSFLSSFPPWTSSLAVSTPVSDGTQKLAAVFGVFHNVITNGGFALPSVPTLITGQATFFADTTRLCSIEYNNESGQINNYYLKDTIGIENLFSTDVIENRDSDLTVAGFWDLDRQNYMKFDGPGLTALAPGSGRPAWTFTPGSALMSETYSNTPGGTRIPYMCNNGALFKTSDGQASSIPIADDNPQWNEYVINSQSGTFVSPQAVTIGNFLCATLAEIPNCPAASTQTSTVSPCCGPSGTCG